jgi:hypothetical protein
MKEALRIGVLGGVALAAAVQCGGEAPGLLIEERTGARIAGRFAGAGGQTVEFSSARSAPLAGDVVITVGSLTYELRYDYGARQVVADGHGGALDRPTHALLRDVVSSVDSYLPFEQADELPLEEQMLYAALTLLQESGGMPLGQLVFELDAEQIDKSLGNDGVTCIEKGSTHAVSFDDSSGTTLDVPVTAGSAECNGQCGPTCTRLTPWVMWTLDCLEHDKCCDATGDPACWVPLGECGDEYADAEKDFLRGFDPLSRHCGG